MGLFGKIIYHEKHGALVDRMYNILVIDNKDEFVENETNILYENRHNKFLELVEEEYGYKETKIKTRETFMG